jgi:hypothetical protein
MTIDIHEYAEDEVLLTGLDNAIIGIVEDFTGRKILYSKTKIINILMVRDGMTESEAQEFYDYNILGLYASDLNPVFLDIEITPVPVNDEWVFNLD